MRLQRGPTIWSERPKPRRTRLCDRFAVTVGAYLLDVEVRRLQTRADSVTAKDPAEKLLHFFALWTARKSACELLGCPF